MPIHDGSINRQEKIIKKKEEKEKKMKGKGRNQEQKEENGEKE